MHIRTDFPRAVRRITNTWIPLADGTRLAARIWLPEDAEDEPVPAILEYLPYRKNDGTAVRDAIRHPYLAGHGYAAVRVDQRGTGDSDGILLDEYLPQEQSDALEVIAWLAEQPWCTGAVGMFGISWGGFNSLQVAAHRPPALKAIITVCSTDDRYADDVHYIGGCVSAIDMLHWAVSMNTFDALPPDPENVGERWREIWLDRLERTPPLAVEWLEHQRRDAYWRQGSVCEDYAAIDCAVYAVGGWADGYTNAIPRLMEGLRCPRKALIGPWAHAYPEAATPGPAIGFLQESVRWWDRWLKGERNGVEDEPMVRAWLQDAVRPAPSYAERPGRWIAEPSWPPPGVERRSLALTAAGTLAAEPGPAAELRLRGVETTGLDAGAWCSDGNSADSPGDQRADDALSLAFDSQPLSEPLDLFGFPVAELTLASDRPLALVAVRLCDVWPDGASTLVTRGLLNLARRDDPARSDRLEPGRRYTVRVRLDAAGYSLPAGHRLRLAVSPSYWPWAWPSPEPVTLTLVAGESHLELPARAPQPRDAELPEFGEPESAPPLELVRRPPGSPGRRQRRDLATGRVEQVFDWDLGGAVRYVDGGLETEDRNVVGYTIIEGDPLSARVDVHTTSALGRGAWRTRVELSGSMTADETHFHVNGTTDAFEGEKRVFTKGWAVAIPRDGA